MEILDYNPFTGETVTMQYNHSDDSLTIGHHQDCTNIIEANKRSVFEANHSVQMKKDWIKYASVPNILILKWKKELGVDFFTTDPTEWKKVMALINSRDYALGCKATPINHDR